LLVQSQKKFMQTRRFAAVVVFSQPSRRGRLGEIEERTRRGLQVCVSRQSGQIGASGAVDDALRRTLTTVGRLGDRLSIARDVLLGVGRIAAFVLSLEQKWVVPEVEHRLKAVAKDIASLNAYEVHLTDKDAKQVRSEMTVVGERIVRELNGGSPSSCSAPCSL
jgi:hypothetical protein